MGQGVSLSPGETPRGNHVVRAILLPIDIRTHSKQSSVEGEIVSIVKEEVVAG